MDVAISNLVLSLPKLWPVFGLRVLRYGA